MSCRCALSANKTKVLESALKPRTVLTPSMFDWNDFIRHEIISKACSNARWSSMQACSLLSSHSGSPSKFNRKHFLREFYALLPCWQLNFHCDLFWFHEYYRWERSTTIKRLTFWKLKSSSSMKTSGKTQQ